MSIGDVTNPKRVRLQANERLDTVDTDPLSLAAREHLDAYSRAVEATPRNVGSSTPTGLIIQGFGLTLNPINPTDGKVRVQSALGVAFDANGRLLIKEAGITQDLTLSAGNSQIYVYYLDTASDTAVRRSISVGSPYTESPSAISTKFTAGVGFFVRAGDQTSIVASDVVNGATTALCFLGVANNAGGAVTMTGYNSTTAPNGAFATNRLTTVAAPTTLPALNTNNGSIATMHGLVNAALWMIGQAVWKGSKNFTPNAANNFGAFTAPTVGIDGLFDDQSETTFTPITRWRDWQQNTRYLIDHQGLPGGQISVKDEHWVDRSDVFHVDTIAGYKIAGSPGTGTTAPFFVQLITTGDTWAVLINNITYGAIITSIVIWYVSGNAANTLTGALHVETLSTGADTTQVSKTITTTGGAGVHTTFDVMSSPSSGHGPKLVRNTEKLQLQLSCTIAGTPINVYDVQIAYVLPPMGWVPFLANIDAIASGDAISFDNPVSGLNQRNVHLTTVGNAVTGGQSQLNGPFEAWVDDDLAHGIEFMLRTGTVIDAANALTFSVVMNLSNGDHWGLLRGAGDTNWKLRLSDDANDQSIDTGVAFASNTVYRVKIDYQGKNRNSSGAARTRLWINGSLVATATALAAITAASAQIQILASTLVNPSGPYDVRVGRIHRAWNHLAAGDNV